MKINNLNQRTSEWYNHRKKYINASEIGSITGNDKFRSLEQLIHDKIFGTTFTSNKFTEHGNKTEPLARTFFEKITNLKFPDTIFTDDTLDMFSASLDGYNKQTNTLLEIKCPYVDENNNISSTWNGFFSHKKIPSNYWAQVQCQLYCSQSKFAYFFVYFNDTNYHVVRVYQDNNFINQMIADGKKYLELLKLNKQELQQTTYLKKLSKFKI
ncbi:endonuclease [Candidatus Phytoplasma luffae]|uniref:Endonuclease n=1 Tax=Loofah witches'-broom phytoplasma TaxID=35773 RepID=A0A975FIC5_LOWBP|nr:YqaJ viral recombinase family protein [Candidatus Phytoplasma luffae]QTX02931.1 endonuclease [Candidatus Phytoplasma luffae]QTX02970.1 endonuclease [Candidatus Phytoplasma luffae]QTX03037.1 endonuclease [Candidatus Phytoplasma luffae]